MSVPSGFYSLQSKQLKVFLITLLFSSQANAFFASCESLGTAAISACSTPFDVASHAGIQTLTNACATADANGIATAITLTGVAGAAGVGGGPVSGAGVQQGGNAAQVPNAGAGAAGSSCSFGGAPVTPTCSAAIGKLMQKCQSYAPDAANAAGGIGSTAAAGGSLMSKMGPLLVGAGLGALAGYMLGGDDDESNSSASTEKPPVLPPPPVTSSSSSSSTSSVASSASSSSSGITTPAVVTIPTVDPNDEGGDDDSEILVSTNDALIDDGAGGDDGGSSSDSTSSSSGGTTGLGGTTGGGTTGNDSTVVDGGDEGSGRDVDDVNVSDDEIIVGLVGAQRTGAGLSNFNSANGAQSPAASGAGSNMVLGAPKRTVTRSLAGSSSSKASSPAAVTKKVVSLSTAQASSATSATRSREQIREDLKRRGLIK